MEPEPIMEVVTGKSARVDARFLIWADFTKREMVPDDDPIWIKGADGEVDSMTYAEFRSHSRVLLASRPLPDGRVAEIETQEATPS